MLDDSLFMRPHGNTQRSEHLKLVMLNDGLFPKNRLNYIRNCVVAIVDDNLAVVQAFMAQGIPGIHYNITTGRENVEGIGI